MSRMQIVTRWLDIRPSEVKSVTLSVLGAFFLLAFVILARSLREASYLTVFDVTTLPYITAAVACLTLPTVVLFVDMLGRYGPRKVLGVSVLALSAGLGALWATGLSSHATIVAFYLWTALGTLLLASGFWVLVAECFAVRGAKRLFGVIVAGGTAGAMATGLSLNWLSGRLGLVQLIPCLIGLLVLFFMMSSLLPRGIQRVPRPYGGDEASGDEAGADRQRVSRGASAHRSRGFSLRDNLGAIWGTPYLRTIALILFAATAASTVVDYQFKELARSGVGTGEELAGFLGAVYGWAGGVALVIQLLVAGRIMASAGVAVGLAILPMLLLLGSFGLAIAPGLALATVLRGGDYSLRKSLLRPVLEFLYVPVPVELRRRTKTFVDTFVDSAAEGTGAAAVFFWVTLSGLPSRYLSVGVIALSGLLLALSRVMGRHYFDTIVNRLKEERAEVAGGIEGRDLHETHLLTASFSRLDIQSLLAGGSLVAGKEYPLAAEDRGAHISAGERMEEPDAGVPQAASSVDTPDGLYSLDADTVLLTLQRTSVWGEEHVPALVRLLVRDVLRDRAVEALVLIGDSAVPHLARILSDEGADFVIRRRIPRVLAGIGGNAAEQALVDALMARRFEVRYRSAIALTRLKKHGRAKLLGERKSTVWDAIRNEVSSDQPIWEMQRLLDGLDPEEGDELVLKRVGVRGERSLEHAFRMLTLVLDPEPVRAAFHGIILHDANLKSFALEYLEQVLPGDIRDRLWLFIGDVSEHRKAKELRSLDQVVSDLMESRATLFRGEKDANALKKILKERGS